VNVRLVARGQTDVGKMRDHNEDSMVIQEMAWSNKGIAHPLGLYVVADGMGGHAAGEVASGAVVNTLAQKMAGEVLARLSGGQPANGFDPVAWLREYSHYQQNNL
jgi:protein phosphatase